MFPMSWRIHVDPELAAFIDRMELEDDRRSQRNARKRARHAQENAAARAAEAPAEPSPRPDGEPLPGELDWSYLFEQWAREDAYVDSLPPIPTRKRRPRSQKTSGE
jgi:hypothetical protein